MKQSVQAELSTVFSHGECEGSLPYEMLLIMVLTVQNAFSMKG